MSTQTMAEAKFKKLLKNGASPIEAAYQSRQWEKAAYPNRWAHCSSTHCERSEECRSPSDCCASLDKLRLSTPTSQP